MATVTFHFNVAQPVPHLCRLLRQVAQTGLTAWVRLPTDEMEALDQALWTFSQEDFLAHARVGSPEAAFSPIVLSDGPAPARAIQVLVNALPGPVGDPGHHERVVEIVGLGEDDRVQARQRWRQYVQAGHTLVAHDAGEASTGP